MLGSKSLPWEQKGFSLLISNDSVSEEIKCISKTTILSRSNQGQIQLGLSFSAPTAIWGWIILCWGSCFCIAGCFQNPWSLPIPCQLRTTSVVTTEHVRVHCHMWESVPGSLWPILSSGEEEAAFHAQNSFMSNQELLMGDPRKWER